MTHTFIVSKKETLVAKCKIWTLTYLNRTVSLSYCIFALKPNIDPINHQLKCQEDWHEQCDLKDCISLIQMCFSDINHLYRTIVLYRVNLRMRFAEIQLVVC